MPDTLLRLHSSRVLPGWVDYNGHMSEAYYVLIFGQATDAFYDHIGLDDTHRRATQTSTYTIESHVNYVNEAHEGQQVAIETQVLAHDAKRIVLYHVMRCAADDMLLAATELMVMHVDKAIMKSAPFPRFVLERLGGCVSGAQPRYSGRRIGLPVRT